MSDGELCRGLLGLLQQGSRDCIPLHLPCSLLHRISTGLTSIRGFAGAAIWYLSRAPGATTQAGGDGESPACSVEHTWGIGGTTVDA